MTINNNTPTEETNKNNLTPNGKRKKPSGGTFYGFKRATCPLCSENITEATGLAHHLRYECGEKAGFVERLDTESNGGTCSNV
tara:strand:+ start:870 stop:1118 length:249 start_codon:yes stop_codon:yes gene_type:complete